MQGTRAKLLIVDDEPSIRESMSLILADIGYRVRTAEEGFSALIELRKEIPDILLSDLNMPGMSGFELLSVVRRRITRIYVIATRGGFSGDGVPHGIAADAFHETATGLDSLFQLVKTAAKLDRHVRAGADASAPFWISPVSRNASSEASVLIACPECLRAFSLSVGAADFVIHETSCVHCDTTIHYATVQPMNPQVPHHFRAHSDEVQTSLALQL